MSKNTQAFSQLLQADVKKQADEKKQKVIGPHLDSRWVFGPNSVLRDCLNEIPAGPGELMRTLEPVETTYFADVYARWISHIGKDNQEVEKELQAQIGAVFSGYRSAVAVLSGADLDEELPKLAEAYDRAWPLQRSYRGAEKTGEQVFDKAFSKWLTGGSLGYWLTRHLYAESKDHGLLPTRQGTGLTPVLFADLDGRVGKIGKLTVEVFSGAGPLIPDPFSLGLTLLSRGEHGFHEALQRAWWRSGLSVQDRHARWRIEPYQPTDLDALAVPVLHGRSVEAAVCCALWAAYGGIPNRDDDRRTLVVLDDHAVVTAMFAGAKEDDFESAEAPSNLANAELEKVKKLPAKLESVKASPIDLVVVRDGQDIDKMYDNGKAGLYIKPVKTIKDAFDELWDLERYMRAYQQQQIKPFREKYYFAPEEEPEPEMAGAEAE